MAINQGQEVITINTKNRAWRVEIFRDHDGGDVKIVQHRHLVKIDDSTLEIVSEEPLDILGKIEEDFDVVSTDELIVDGNTVTLQQVMVALETWFDTKYSEALALL